MNPNSTTTSSAAGPDAVSRRAYELWEKNGKPEGRDLEHWLQAEQEIGGNNQQSNGKHSNGQSSAGNTSSAQASTSKRTDTRPLQSTGGTPAATRDTKQQRPTSPFGDRAPSSSGGQTAGTKRR